MNEILKVIAGYSNYTPRVQRIRPHYYSTPPSITLYLADEQERVHEFPELNAEEFRRQWHEARAYWEQVSWIDE